MPMQLTAYRLITYCSLLFNLFLCTGVAAQAPGKKPDGMAAARPAATSLGNSRLQLGPVCATNTFYLHLPALPGEQLRLNRLQTFPDGNYVALATATRSDGSTEGVMLLLAPDGSLLKQQRCNLEGRAVTIGDGTVSVTGNLYIAGLVNDGSNSVFLACIKEDFSLRWCKSIAQAALPAAVSLGVLDDDHIALAVQLPGTIVYGFYATGGIQRWQKNLGVAALTGLAGFNGLNNGTLGLVINSITGGKQTMQLAEINQANGNLLNTTVEGNGTNESLAMAVTSFNSRLSILGMMKTGTGTFNGFRNIMYAAAVTETQHQFFTPEPIDFSANAAMDNAGDALAYLLPAQGELVLIKHFAAYSTNTEFARKYAMPGAARLAGLTRSFDGGFLLGVNTTGATEIVLMKTDSAGLLPGCGQQTVTITTTEKVSGANTAASAAVTNSIANTAGRLLNALPAAFTTSFDCNQQYCPVDPITDTCLSTYYKTFRSGSYIDQIRNYVLLKNDRQLLGTERFERIYGNLSPETYGLKLLDQGGALLKAVDIYNDTASQPTKLWKMDDSQVMLTAYTPAGGNQRFGFTLLDDNLVKKWQKTIVTYDDWQSSGLGIIDMHKDQEGNFYAIATRGGFAPVKPAIFIYKMDALGKEVWTRAYETGNGIFETACITSTAGSIIIVIEGGGVGSGLVSLRLDKLTGQFQNSYTTPIYADGTLYTRTLGYTQGRILYAGSRYPGNFLMGSFDSTGRPLRFRVANEAGSIMRSAAVKDGNLFSTFIYFRGTGYKEALLKADTGLNINFVNEYDEERHRISKQLWVSNTGNIFSGGNFLYGGINGEYEENFIIKYDPLGQVGTCNFQPADIVFSDIAPAAVSTVFTPIARNYPETPFTVNLIPTSAQLNVENVLCSSTPLCSFIRLTAPGPVCKLNTIYPIRFSKDALCTLRPQWQFDTAYLQLNTTTDTTGLFSFKKPGNTWLKASLNTGCSVYADSLLLQIQAPANAFSLGADTILCAGDSVLLHAGAGFAQYQWQDGTTDSIYMVHQPGRYAVTVVNGCSETAADTIAVLPAVVPALSLGPDKLACYKDSVVLTASPGFVNYAWQPGNLIRGKGQAVTIAALATTAIYLEATTINGCRARDTITITVTTPRPIHLGNDTAFCAADSLLLQAGAGYINYSWNNGSHLPSIWVHTAGTYQVVATDTNHCPAADTLVVKEVYATPAVSLGPDRDICTGQQILLNGGSFAGYLWSTGSTSQAILVGHTGIYTLTVTDSHQCRGTDSIIIQHENPLPAAFLKETDTICKYGKLTIIPSKTYRTYQWSNGSFQSTLVAASPGWYSLLATDSNGCRGSDSILLIQKQCLTGFFVPNVFSPNNDRRNDDFKPLVYGPVLHYSFHLYNRFGQEIFSTADPEKAWDGLFKGKPCDTGNYIWQCNYQFEGGPPTYEKGFVLLLR